MLVTGSAFHLRAQTDPASLPSRDAHDNLVIAADPYLEEVRYKDRFGKKNPFEAGVVAIEVFFRNEGDKPIRIGLEGIRLTLRPSGENRQRLEPLGSEEVADLVFNKGGQNPTISRAPYPRRGPKPARGKDWQQLETALRSVALGGDLVPPHGAIHGFLYFDLGHRYEWIPSGTLYFPDVKTFPEQKALLYFEVSLAAVRPR
jgi:hypothetical protein